MMNRNLAIVFMLTATAAQPLCGQDDRHATVVLTGARLLDPSGQRLLDPRDVLLRDGKIVAIGRTENAHPDAVRVDLSGLTLLPGLIDLHSHLLLHPYNEATWNDQVLKESVGLRTIRAVTAAAATLEAGFTTIRDLGTEGAGFADLALRDAIASRMIPGPRIFAATRAIVATGCYGPSGFDPRWSMPKGAQVADGVDGVRRATREQIAAGADWIKVYADYRRRSDGKSYPTFSQDELDAVVDEARSVGLPVAAHAVTDEAIRRAVRAGVKTIEHGSEASAEVFALMRDGGVVLCPTLAAGDAIARYAGWKVGTPDPPRVVKSKAMFRRALASGVTIACGSDVGVFTHGENHRELKLMVAYGMSPAKVVQAATATAAGVLSRGDDLGRLETGYVADLIAVSGNPLADIAVLRNPVVVIQDGRIVVDRR